MILSFFFSFKIFLGKKKRGEGWGGKGGTEIFIFLSDVKTWFFF